MKNSQVIKKGADLFQNKDLNNLPKSKSEQIRQTFLPMADKIKEFENIYDEILKESENGITLELTKKAKRVRLDIAKIRIETEKIRKEKKQEYLVSGRAIDGVSNILKWAVSEKEQNLKNIEDYFIIQEKERLEKIKQQRIELLRPYVEDAEDRDVLKFTDDEFEALLSFKKKEHEDMILAKEEAEKKAKEEAEKQNKYRKRLVDVRKYGNLFDFDKLYTETSDDEYSKLVADADKKLKAFEAEQKRIEKENERLKEKARLEEEKRKKAEAEIKAKKKAEKERLAKQEAERQLQLAKDDNSKIKNLVNDLEAIKTKYTFKSKRNKERFDKVVISIDSLISMF